MAFEAGHEKKGGRTKGSSNKKTQQTKEFMMEITTNPTLRKKYIREMKGDNLTGKQYIDAYHGALDYTIGKMNKVDPNIKKLPSITINLIAANPEQKTLPENNPIDITHEEINPDS